MKQYRVLARSFIDGALVEPGAIVSLQDDQKAGTNLEPLDAPRDDSKPRPIPQRKVDTPLTAPVPEPRTDSKPESKSQ